MKNNVIAVDGFCASGKGTIAKKLSEKLNLPYLNTGALYRAVGYELKKNNFEDFNNIEKILELAKNINFEVLDNLEFFTEDTGIWASKIAKIQQVRDFLFNIQKEFTKKPNGAILDGRDIGTVICPEAEYKFFITASLEERTKRRYKEMLEKGKNTTFEEIFQQLKERDLADINRSVSPLKKAEDAIEIDTTKMSPDEVIKYVLSFINK